ncbi:cytochrome [Moniliophthora roreri]|nr:cytochrome [Moniliophthora roreri]
MFLPERCPNNEYGTKLGADVSAFRDNSVFGYRRRLVSMTLPFKCHIQPRNTNVSNIIEREHREAVETFIKLERDLAPADTVRNGQTIYIHKADTTGFGIQNESSEGSET